MSHVVHVLAVIFAWPDGIVVGNLLAEVLVVAFAFAFRDHLMKRFVRFHHRHKVAHEAQLEKEKNG